MTSIERLSNSCNRSTERLILLLGLTMTALVIVQVFCRYVLNHSLFWSEELARYLLVWLTFLGATVAYHRSMHPSINVVFRRLSKSGQLINRRLIHFISLIFFIILIWYGCSFSYFIRAQTTPALSLPKWLIFSIIPISGMIFVVHAFAFLQKDFSQPQVENKR